MTEVQLTEDNGTVRFEGNLTPDYGTAADPTFTGTTTVADLVVTGNADIGSAGTDEVGFYGHAGIAQQTGVAVSDAAIHAALVALGLITA